MIRLLRMLRSRRGSAAVEMALVTPLLLALGIGSVELGNFMLDQHRLTKAVRDAARYAARQPFSTYNACTPPSTVNVPSGTSPNNIPANVTALVHTGQLSGGTDQLANWSNLASSVTLQMRCTPLATQIGNQLMSGVYNGNVSGSVVVIVTGTVRYKPLVKAFGFTGEGFDLYAKEEAPVSGV